MKSKLKNVLSSLILIAATMSVCAEESADTAAIENAVFDYFHGQGQASSRRLHRAFAANIASMVGVIPSDNGEDKLRVWRDMNEIIANWSANPEPPGDKRDGEIISLEIADERLATVLFRSTDMYYDALILAKVAGEWKIVSKAFIYQ